MRIRPHRAAPVALHVQAGASPSIDRRHHVAHHAVAGNQDDQPWTVPCIIESPEGTTESELRIGTNAGLTYLVVEGEKPIWFKYGVSDLVAHFFLLAGNEASHATPRRHLVASARPVDSATRSVDA
jgi:hypothetical protein